MRNIIRWFSRSISRYDNVLLEDLRHAVFDKFFELSDRQGLDEEVVRTVIYAIQKIIDQSYSRKRIVQYCLSFRKYLFRKICK